MRNRLTSELAVCGFNAVKALGAIHPEQVNRLFLREDRLPFFSGLCKNLAERKRPYKMCGDEELEKIAKTSHHQGIVAMIHEPVVEAALPEDLDAWAAAKKTGLLLCDVGNDLNLGAIVRSAAFFDASPLILAEESPRLSTGAYRAAEGGMEHVEFRSVRSAAAFLRSASKQLVSIGADPRARIRIGDLPSLIKEQVKPKAAKRPGIVLALGSEETGLSQDIKEQCSILARIPGTGAIESLNVAQAAALFLQKLYDGL